jgi:hypothetical protein
MRELTHLDVAARLAAVLLEKTTPVVAAATRVPSGALLDMISGARDFPRPVLRYLGLRKVYLEDADAGAGLGFRATVWRVARAGLAHRFRLDGDQAESLCGMVRRTSAVLRTAAATDARCQRCATLTAADE